jgi:hypothetical protein
VLSWLVCGASQQLSATSRPSVKDSGGVYRPEPLCLPMFALVRSLQTTRCEGARALYSYPKSPLSGK